MQESIFEEHLPGGKPILACNVGCMLPYMDYEPRTLEEIVDGYTKMYLKKEYT